MKDLTEVFKPSLTKIVIRVLPVRPLAGVIVTLRFCPLPPNVMFPDGTSVVSEEMAVTVRLDGLDSASLTVNPMVLAETDHPRWKRETRRLASGRRTSLVF